jgi:hypothetical protein
MGTGDSCDLMWRATARRMSSVPDTGLLPALTRFEHEGRAGDRGQGEQDAERLHLEDLHRDASGSAYLGGWADSERTA